MNQLFPFLILMRTTQNKRSSLGFFEEYWIEIVRGKEIPLGKNTGFWYYDYPNRFKTLTFFLLIFIEKTKVLLYSSIWSVVKNMYPYCTLRSYSNDQNGFFKKKLSFVWKWGTLFVWIWPQCTLHIHVFYSAIYRQKL